MKKQKTIAVLGGGAAGLMAAIAAATHEVGIAPSAPLSGVRNDSSHTRPTRVLLFEKNKYLGAKVLISGGGRCNVTTGVFDVRKLMENYPRGAKFLLSAMYRFPPEKVKEWFEEHGVPLKIEEDLRIFPVSDNGADVVGALEAELRRLGVARPGFFRGHSRVCPVSNRCATEIFLNSNVVDVRADGEGFCVSLKDGTAYQADAVIVTTGGNAYRHTGSTGDGYAFAKNFGHTITPLAASLNSFVVSESLVKKLAGVSLEKVALVLEGLQSHKRTGAAVFTHHGLSGPAVFAMSAAAAYESYDRAKPMKLRMNFFPDSSAEALRERWLKMADASGKKLLVNFLDMFLPRSLCGVFLEILKLDSDMQTAKLSREMRDKILALMQNFVLNVVGRGAGDEFVTAGGVSLDEVNTNTMESKKRPGLYFAGEILDVDGFTGGFNLQASWATGKLAGECAARLISN